MSGEAAQAFSPYVIEKGRPLHALGAQRIGLLQQGAAFATWTGAYTGSLSVVAQERMAPFQPEYRGE